MRAVSGKTRRTFPALSRLRRGALLAVAVVLSTSGTANASVSITPDVTDKVAGGGVRAIVNVGDRTFIGGSFTGVGGQARSNVAALKSDGDVDRLFTAGTNGKVLALAASADGSVIFMGGTFSEAGGAPRANLAAVNAVTGEAVAGWQADTIGRNPDVNTLAVHGDRLYVGGRFTGIDGSSRDRMVALDATTGDLVSAFRPAPNGGVTELVVSPDGGTVYAGGAFDVLGGAIRHAAGSVESASGTATGFAPTGDGGYAVTIGLSPDGERFFYGTANNTLFAYDPHVADDPVWSIKTSGNTQAIAVSNDEMWIGGHFSQIVTGKIKRTFIASLDPVDGSVNDWDPDCVGAKQGVWALALEGTHLHVGGYFSGFGTVKQRGYARFSQVL